LRYIPVEETIRSPHTRGLRACRSGVHRTVLRPA
jgi:hypothetical protein